MDVDQMIKVWAANRLSLPVDYIAHVEFEHEDGAYYSEYTFEPEHNGAVVNLSTGQTPRYISIDDGVKGFTDLLKEIMEANASGRPD